MGTPPPLSPAGTATRRGDGGWGAPGRASGASGLDGGRGFGGCGCCGGASTGGGDGAGAEDLGWGKATPWDGCRRGEGSAGGVCREGVEVEGEASSKKRHWETVWSPKDRSPQQRGAARGTLSAAGLGRAPPPLPLRGRLVMARPHGRVGRRAPDERGSGGPRGDKRPQPHGGRAQQATHPRVPAGGLVAGGGDARQCPPGATPQPNPTAGNQQGG